MCVKKEGGDGCPTMTKLNKLDLLVCGDAAEDEEDVHPQEEADGDKDDEHDDGYEDKVRAVLGDVVQIEPAIADRALVVFLHALDYAHDGIHVAGEELCNVQRADGHEHEELSVIASLFVVCERKELKGQ